MAASKKEIEIYHPRNSPMFAMRFVKGGQLPRMLEGLFTSMSVAEKMRDLYYSQRPTPKKAKEAPKETKSSEE